MVNFKSPIAENIGDFKSFCLIDFNWFAQRTFIALLTVVLIYTPTRSSRGILMNDTLYFFILKKNGPVFVNNLSAKGHCFEEGFDRSIRPSLCSHILNFCYKF